MTTPSLTAVIRAGMTHKEVRDAVRLCWPDITVEFYHSTTAYFHEGADAKDCYVEETYVLPSTWITDPILLTGDLSLVAFRDMVYKGFGFEPEYYYRDTSGYVPGDTMNEKQANAARWAVLFEARYGHLPTAADRFDASLLKKPRD